MRFSFLFRATRHVVPMNPAGFLQSDTLLMSRILNFELLGLLLVFQKELVVERDR
jgi:hypothetical protein